MNLKLTVKYFEIFLYTCA